MNVALYLRVSSEEQAKGHSMDDQRAQLQDWANSQGWTVAGTYEDPGFSATSALSRPGFQQMIEDASLGLFQRILVKRRDRYARDLVDAGTYERMLKGMGVSVWSLEEPATNEDTPAGFLMRGFTDLMAAHYSKELSHKTTQGWKRRAMKGLPAGDVPYGYETAGAEPPQQIPTEAAVVLELFSSYAVGDVSLMDLADRLNTRGLSIRTKKGSKPWSQAAIDGILHNPFYQGDILYKGEVVAQGLHEPIIARSLFAQVQTQLERRHRAPRSVAYTQRTYILSGLGRCAACSAALWSNSSKRGFYYRCSSFRKGGECTAKGTGARADLIDDQVGAMFRDMDIPDSWRAEVRRIIERGAGEADRAEVQRRLKRAQGLLLDGLVDDVQGVRRVRELQEQLDALEPGRDVGWALEQVVNLQALWPKMTPEERKALVALALEDVTVDVETKRLAAFKPAPELKPLFHLLGERGQVTVSTWRPRSDSSFRSTDGYLEWVA